MQLLQPCCWMEWSEWNWLILLVFLVLLLAVVMSWPNNLDPNHRTAQPPQHASTSTTLTQSQLAHTTTASSTRTAQPAMSQAPSMDLSLPATPPTASFSTPADEHAYIATLLQHAHSSLAQHKPMQALGLVLAAVRQQRGEEGVFDVLNETREGYGLKPHTNPVRQQREMQQQQLQAAAMDDGGDLGMAGLSLRSVDVQSQWQQNAQWVQLNGGGGGGSYQDTDMADDSGGEVEDDDEEQYGEEVEASILDETGNGELVDEAVRAGTHTVCRACGGVIARDRMQAHVELWCEANNNT